MRTFILTGHRNHGPILGNWYQLIHHAREAVTDNQNLILELCQARTVENHCQLIAELSREGMHPIENGKQQTINSLLAD